MIIAMQQGRRKEIEMKLLLVGAGNLVREDCQRL